jgi:hypothetical protein
MPPAQIDRAAILAALRAALEPRADVLAMWEGGAAAFDRVDEWSDIDVQFIADDDAVDAVVAAAEAALAGVAPIALKYAPPPPTWHGHYQGFYRLTGAGPYLVVDVVVMRRSNENRFLEPEIHGQKRVHFDKAGLLVVAPLDPAAFAARLIGRLEAMRPAFDMFQSFVVKELNRGNAIEALHYYLSFTMRPLVEALRIRYSPFRYNFHSRYVYYDLPPEVVQTLERLFFVRDGADLRVKHAEAGELFDATLAAIEPAPLEAGLAEAQARV